MTDHEQHSAFVGADRSLAMARGYLGTRVRVVVDRPLGSRHPEADFEYRLNYGYVPDTLAPDGEELDAYLIGLDGAVSEATGLCIAIVHRLYEDDDKLVVAVDGTDRTDDAIRSLVAFQEGDRPHVVVRS